jgi:hypothetical protein
MEFEPLTLTLRITFVSGMVYDYLSVPQSVYDAMKSSGSKGIYFNRHVKNKFPFLKIK